MKEFSIEEKAQRYDKAIERAKRAHNSAKSDKENGVTDKITEYTIQLTESFFPELIEFPALIESEDVRISKALIRYFTLSDEHSYNEACGVSYRDIVAWLEKQGKQKLVEKYNITGIGSKNAQGKLSEMIKNLKPSDKVEPKFNVGDKIQYLKDCGVIVTIEKIENGEYIFGNNMGHTNIESGNKWHLVEHNPIGKVEPKFYKGDWLVNIEYGNVVRVLEVLKDNYRLDFGGDTIGTLCTELVDNDYRLWDISKDAKDGDVLVCKGNIKYSNGIKYERICLFNNLGNAFFTLTKISNCVEDYGIDVNIDYPDNTVPATKEQKEILFMAMKDAGYTFDFEKKELKKIEQKSIEWSEEDENIKQLIINILTRQGFQTQVNWLKSLRPQKQWKPSEEQMEALKTSYLYWKGITKEVPYTEGLESLYEQLKKLREG